MRIRKLRVADIGEVVQLIHAVYGTADAKKAYRDLTISLQRDEHSPYAFEEFFVIEVDGVVRGAGGFWALQYEPKVAHLDWFVVDPRFQRKGMGTVLLRHCERELHKRKIALLTAETSGGKPYKAAVSFYLHNGFRLVAEIPKYWEDGTSWVYFCKRL